MLPINAFKPYKVKMEIITFTDIPDLHKLFQVFGTKNVVTVGKCRFSGQVNEPENFDGILEAVFDSYKKPPPKEIFPRLPLTGYSDPRFYPGDGNLLTQGFLSYFDETFGRTFVYIPLNAIGSGSSKTCYTTYKTDGRDSTSCLIISDANEELYDGSTSERNEIDGLTLVNGHSGFPLTRAIFSSADTVYIVQRQEQSTLDTVVEEDDLRDTSIFTRITLADHLIEAVDFLHSRKFVHRDICYENVLVNISEQFPENTRAVLCDFGSCTDKFVKPYKSFIGHLKFAPFDIAKLHFNYRDPDFETMKQLNNDFSYDIYCLGIVLSPILCDAVSNYKLNSLLSLETFNKVKEATTLAVTIKYESPLKQLLLDMLNFDHKKRPSIKTVKERFNALKKDNQLAAMIKASFPQTPQ